VAFVTRKAMFGVLILNEKFCPASTYRSKSNGFSKLIGSENLSILAALDIMQLKPLNNYEISIFLEDAEGIWWGIRHFTMVSLKIGEIFENISPKTFSNSDRQHRNSHGVDLRAYYQSWAKT
jgi:hypothetical protein